MMSTFVAQATAPTQSGGMDKIKLELPKIDRATAIGICIAIAGNILISFALNLQKLAHRRRDLENRARWEGRKPDDRTFSRPLHAGMERVREASGDEQEEVDSRESVGNRDRTSVDEYAYRQSLLESGRPTTLEEQSSHTSTYGSSPSSLPTVKARTRKSLFSLISPSRSRSPVKSDTHNLSTRPTSEHARLLSPSRVRPSSSNPQVLSKPSHTSSAVETGNEGDYLKSKLWWTGFMLMNVGEMGNFISYAFAPASIVAPLGTFALVANCFFAPLLLKERFRKVEIFGIVVAILGAITVVLSTNTSETRLNRDDLIRAISGQSFIIYSVTYLFGVIILSGLSAGATGKDWVFVDVGLCALFGGFTVLSTKALSTLITMEWIRVFAEWITYPIVLTLVVTGIGQIRYLNRALMHFDSKIVIPTQFVLFNLSAIIGSAILYGDFAKASFHQMVTFLYGCTATFAGVYMIAWSGPANASPDQDGEQTDLDAAGRSTPGELSRLVTGSLSRGTQVRRKHSSTSLVGFSPAQRLLIAHSPTRDGMDVEQEPIPSPGSIGRRKTVNWSGEELMDRQQNYRRIPLGAGASNDSAVVK